MHVTMDLLIGDFLAERARVHDVVHQFTFNSALLNDTADNGAPCRGVTLVLSSLESGRRSLALASVKESLQSALDNFSELGAPIHATRGRDDAGIALNHFWNASTHLGGGSALGVGRVLVHG